MTNHNSPIEIANSPISLLELKLVRPVQAHSHQIFLDSSSGGVIEKPGGIQFICGRQSTMHPNPEFYKLLKPLEFEDMLWQYKPWLNPELQALLQESDHNPSLDYTI